MKHVRVRITADGHEAEIHPMYDVWANASFIKRTTDLQGNFTGDPLGILHYAVGDADTHLSADPGPFCYLNVFYLSEFGPFSWLT